MEALDYLESLQECLSLFNLREKQLDDDSDVSPAAQAENRKKRRFNGV